MLRPELGSDHGGELSQNDLKALGTVAGAAALGAAAGGFAAAEYTKINPVDVSFSPDIAGEASFTNSPGVVVANNDQRLASPNAEVKTGLPGLRGVKVTITRPDLYQELRAELANPGQASGIEKQLIGVISKPEVAKTEVSDSLTSTVVGGASGTALLAVGLAIGLRKLRPLKRMTEVVDRINNRWGQSAVKAGTIITAATVATGCGYKGLETVMAREDMGRPLPAEIAKRSPQLENARVRGALVEAELQKAVAAIDRGNNQWDETNADVNSAISRDRLTGRGVSHSTVEDSETIITATGILCNSGYVRTVYQSIQWRYKHNATMLAGDNHITGNRWSIESDCMPMIRRHTIGANNLSALANHDGKPGPWDISKDNGYVKQVNGSYYVSVPDPRNMMGDKQAQPPSGVDLKLAIAKAGSLVANKSCSIQAATGRRPRVVVSSPEMGFETILRGCATTVSSDHYIFSKSPTRPVLRNVLHNGNVVHQFVNPSSAGAKTNYEFYKGPQKLAATGLQTYDKQTGELTAAKTIVYGPNSKAEVINQDTNRTVRPNQAMINFVMSYSPTGSQLAIG